MYSVYCNIVEFRSIAIYFVFYSKIETMNLEQIITTYQTPDQARELIDATRIVLLVGISGAGKDTIKSKLLTHADFMDIVSHTTRTPRSNNGVEEQNGIDYHFITTDDARAMLDADAFIEAKYVHGTIYGTSIAALETVHNANKIAVTDLDVQGVDEYRAISPAVTALFIVPPDYETWRERLAKRYDSAEAFEVEWPKRRESAIKELTHALDEVPYYHFIINDDLDRAVRVISEIAHRPDGYNRHDDEARLRARDLLDTLHAAN